MDFDGARIGDFLRARVQASDPGRDSFIDRGIFAHPFALRTRKYNGRGWFTAPVITGGILSGYTDPLPGAAM
jgi:hypothetical protein